LNTPSLWLRESNAIPPLNFNIRRDIPRPAVISRKVTNGFRSAWGAQTDAALRTVIDTERLNGTGPYHAIRNTIAT
jgi:transposase